MSTAVVEVAVVVVVMTVVVVVLHSVVLVVTPGEVTVVIGVTADSLRARDTGSIGRMGTYLFFAIT